MADQGGYSAVKEIVDRLPVADGGIRRRFTAGLLFVLIFLFGTVWFPGVPLIADQLKEIVTDMDVTWNVVNSTGALVIVFSILFVIGNLIDVFAYVFLNRIFKIVGGGFVYQGLRSAMSDTAKEAEANFSRSADEQETFTRLPDYVRDGLIDPYDRRFEVAYRYLIWIAPADEKNWLTRVDSRNQNLFSVLSTVFVSAFLLIVAGFADYGITYYDEYTARKAQTTVPTSKTGIPSPEILGAVALEARKTCYMDVIDKLRRDKAPNFTETSVLSLQNDVQRAQTTRDFAIVATLTLGILSPEAGGGAIENGSRHFSNAASRAYESCDNAAPVIKIFLFDFARFFAFFAVFSALLAALYSRMLRYSIASVLEMLTLRKNIRGDVDFGTDGPSSDGSSPDFGGSDAPESKGGPEAAQ